MQIARRRVTQITMLCVGCAAILLGLWLVKWQVLRLEFSALWFVLVLPVLYVATRWRGVVAIVLIAIVGVATGVQRGSALQAQLDNYANFVGQKVEIEGTIKDDPAYDDKSRLDFRLHHVRINDQKMPGQVRVWTQQASGLQRGDQVRVSGSLREGFGNYQASASFASVQLLQKSPSLVEKIRRQFFVGVYNAIPDPFASLGLGFLVGFKSQLPGELEEQLRLLALTHIVVASGYNLTVLVRLAKRLLAKTSKFQAYVGALTLMCCMLTLTGFSPSMTRAGVVTFLALSTWYFGRTIHPILLLLLSAALTAWWNPLSTWSDLGWWLSFLAFAGVLIVGPLLTKRMYGERAPPALLQITIETIAAQAMVEPLIMLLFGQFSVLGLLANVLVVPFIPLAMLTTLIAGLAGMSLPIIAGWLAVPAVIVLGYIVEVVRLLSKVPWASLELPINIVGFCVLYACLAATLIVLARKCNFRFRQTRSVID